MEGASLERMPDAVVGVCRFVWRRLGVLLLASG
jgi:hypothetical protein